MRRGTKAARTMPVHGRVAVAPTPAQQQTVPSPTMNAFPSIEPTDPSYPKALADYCAQPIIVEDGQVQQVYEALLNLAYWIRGFAPHNVLEIGTAGATFFLLSRLATGKKVSVDVYDRRLKILNFMFG